MKILITGIVASGKTTLAKKLSHKLDIPYYEEWLRQYSDKLIWIKHPPKNLIDML